MSLLVDELAARLYWRRMPAVPPDVAQWYGAPFRGYALGAVREVLTGTWQLRPAAFATVRLVRYGGQLPGEAQSAVCAIRLRRPLPVVEVLVPPVDPMSRTDALPHLNGLGGGLEVRAADPAAATQVLAAVQRYLAGCEPGWYFRTSGTDMLSWWPVRELPVAGAPSTYHQVPAPPMTAATVQWRLDRLCHLADLMAA
ncbi:MAG: hypothetical protein GEV07_08485 [Streptosporangiales bacterium]|nr:hypothetical protein [Streptosporangiales bacterium]